MTGPLTAPPERDWRLKRQIVAAMRTHPLQRSKTDETQVKEWLKNQIVENTT